MIAKLLSQMPLRLGIQGRTTRPLVSCRVDARPHARSFRPAGELIHESIDQSIRAEFLGRFPMAADSEAWSHRFNPDGLSTTRTCWSAWTMRILPARVSPTRQRGLTWSSRRDASARFDGNVGLFLRTALGPATVARIINLKLLPKRTRQVMSRQTVPRAESAVFKKIANDSGVS